MRFDDAEWREVQDPHSTGYWWRCKNLVLEFQWRFADGSWSAWYAKDRYKLFQHTEARKAMWYDLFINPATDAQREG